MHVCLMFLIIGTSQTTSWQKTKRKSTPITRLPKLNALLNKIMFKACTVYKEDIFVEIKIKMLLYYHYYFKVNTECKEGQKG